MASNTRKSSTAITSENKGHSFKMKAYWLSRSAIHKLRHSKRDLLLVLLLASSAVALTSPSIWRAMLSGNNAAFVSQSVPASMTAGGTYPVTVTMLNQGTTTWTPGQLYRLGSQNPQDNGTWGGRISLPGASVSPGATATFSFMVTAPSSPGSYNFQWQMVQDGVEWFGAKTQNIAVQVDAINCVSIVPTNRWKGEYFNNTDLSGGPLMVRDDGANFLNFDFGAGGPSAACGIGVDNFSARWTRTVNFDAGLYRFSVTGDDGVKVYIDGQPKIDKWVLQSPTTYTADVALPAGNHEVKLEYFEGGGTALAILSWTLVRAPGCLPNSPLTGATPLTGSGASVATNPASEAPKRCGQKSSD
ncbi:MAG: hypothetical protein J2P21_25420 [Chloracidobacterium sp.]|nr:hypothetical protein [Chloracidobacterium sp.]